MLKAIATTVGRINENGMIQQCDINKEHVSGIVYDHGSNMEATGRIVG